MRKENCPQILLQGLETWVAGDITTGNEKKHLIYLYNETKRKK